MTTWWQGLATIETDGPGGAEDHRLSWHDGGLHLVAHPDPDADRALAALGGGVCPCLDLLEAWEANHRTGSILLVGARTPAGLVVAPSVAIDAISVDLLRWRSTRATLLADARAAGDGDVIDRLTSLRVPEEAEAERRLGGLRLLTLDPRLQHRLQASVAAAMAERPEQAAALTAATAGRALGPLRDVGWSGGVEDIRLGATPELTAATAVLPPTWLAAVWGRDLASGTPDGAFVLDVTSVTSEGMATVLVASPGKGRVEIRVVQWENA